MANAQAAIDLELGPSATSNGTEWMARPTQPFQPGAKRESVNYRIALLVADGFITGTAIYDACWPDR